MCKFCGGGPVSGDIPYHEQCRAEWERRMDDGECVYCGRCNAYHTFPCAECGVAGDMLYSGYPGGDKP